MSRLAFCWDRMDKDNRINESSDKLATGDSLLLIELSSEMMTEV